MDRVRLTRQGYEKLRSELEYLMTKKRRVIAQDLQKAREFGDLKENAEYDAAKNQQAMNEERIATLQNKITSAEILDESNVDISKILMGVTATLKDLETDVEIHYTIVDGEEMDIEQNKISVSSPIGQALLGHKVGDKINIQVPAGTLSYEVIKISR